LTSFFRGLYNVLHFGKGIVSLLMCVTVAQLLLNMDMDSKRTFFEISISTVLYPAQFAVSWINEIKMVRDENSRLLHENARLTLANDLKAQAVKENERLRHYLKFKKSKSYPLKLAQIIARNPGRFQTTFVINIGSRDSVKTNMPVLTPSGLVGRTSKIFHSHSHVQLLNDPMSKVSVAENFTRTVGILETIDAYHLHVVFPSHAKIHVGDSIISTGYGGIFPKGLMIGTVSGIEPGNIEVVKHAQIDLMQDPSYVEEVFVLMKDESWNIGADD